MRGKTSKPTRVSELMARSDVHFHLVPAEGGAPVELLGVDLSIVEEPVTSDSPIGIYDLSRLLADFSIEELEKYRVDSRKAPAPIGGTKTRKRGSRKNAE